MSGRGYPSSDRQVSDLMPPMTTNVSAPDPTAGECICEVLPEKYHHVHYGITEPGSMWDWNPDCPVHPGDRLVGPATPDADDASTEASEPLTEAEVETLADAFVAANRAEFMDTDFDLPIQQAVERIKAAAATKTRAEGVRAAIYELGLWCGECDPADPDDDCCVVDQRVRALLEASRMRRDHLAQHPDLPREDIETTEGDR